MFDKNLTLASMEKKKTERRNKLTKAHCHLHNKSHHHCIVHQN